MSQSNSLMHARGFTLIELMVVVAIIAIIASIAIPSYDAHIRKSRRAVAKADLVEYAQLAERFHTSNNTYAGFSLPNAVSPREGGTVAYTIAAVTTQSTFTLTATPDGKQTKDPCGTLSLDQAGGKVSGGPLSECW